MHSSRVGIFFGAYPPPVHGLSSINKAMHERLRDHFARTVVIDTVYRSQSKQLRYLAGKLVRRVSSLISLWANIRKEKNPVVLYVGLSGGYGQLFEAAAFGIARSYSASIIIHHHSFAYINSRSILTAMTFAIAGNRTIHLTLCDAMKSGLQSLYPAVKQAIVISNSMFIRSVSNADKPLDRPLKTIGFLSNITLDKGIDRFVETLELLKRNGHSINAVVAGPISDFSSKEIVSKAVQSKLIEYVGPIYDDAKLAFMLSIDLLFFPSRYFNEAEPLAVLEALSCGVPVIASSRGCLPTIVTPNCGELLDRSASQIDAAAAAIIKWQSAPMEFIALRNGAVSQFKALQQQAEAGEKLLLKHLDQAAEQ